MTVDPYVTPASPLADLNDAPVAMHTPTQVGLGTFLGGPAALVYFLRANFLAMRDAVRAKQVLLLGLFGVPLWAAVVWMLPDGAATSIGAGLTIGGYFKAERSQMTKQAILDSPDHFAHSNWRVLGLGLLCMVATILAIAVPVALLVFAGVIE